VVKYLLDTDHFSFLQRGSGKEFTQLMTRMDQYSSTEFAVSIISFHEQVLGAHNFINRARTNRDIIRGYTLLQEILQGFTSFSVLPFDTVAVSIFNELRENKVRGSTMDLRIGAIALSRNLILLTRNVADFNKIPNLKIENWTVDP
jgi:tRNA(fMet)-specific endonuclease VapC